MGQSKNKECKKHYHSAMNVFQVCIGIVYNSFILELGISIISISTALLLWRYCKIYTNFFQNTCFKENDNVTVEKISSEQQIFRKNVFQLSHGTKYIQRSKLHL